MNDSNDNQTGLVSTSVAVPPSAQSSVQKPKGVSPEDGEETMEIGSEPKDKGEASEKNTTPSEQEAKKNDMIQANTQLVEKILEIAVSTQMLEKNQVENFVLPNKDKSIGKMKKEIGDLNGKLNTGSMIKEEEREGLLSQRAMLVTELLYSSTALVGKELPNFAHKLVEKVREARMTEDSSAVAKQVKEIKIIAPQWDALVENSKQVMNFLRLNHAIVVSDEYLGGLNQALYLELNLNPNNLNNGEDHVGNETLFYVMELISKRLDALSQARIPVAKNKFSKNDSGVYDFGTGGSGGDAGGNKGEGETVLEDGTGAFGVVVPIPAENSGGNLPQSDQNSLEEKPAESTKNAKESPNGGEEPAVESPLDNEAQPDDVQPDEAQLNEMQPDEPYEASLDQTDQMPLNQPDDDLEKANKLRNIT